MNQLAYKYLPDYIVKPGEVIEDYMLTDNLSKRSLARNLGMTEVELDKLLHGEIPIDSKIAKKLAATFFRPSDFWLELENNFQKDKQRLGIL